MWTIKQFPKIFDYSEKTVKLCVPVLYSHQYQLLQRLWFVYTYKLQIVIVKIIKNTQTDLILHSKPPEFNHQRRNANPQDG